MCPIIIIKFKVVKLKQKKRELSILRTHLKHKMMKSSGGKAPQNNAVVDDRQWIRRVKQEEINMIDSFSGAKLDQIN